MEVKINIEKEFERLLSNLLMKYRSIIVDYEIFLDELDQDFYLVSILVSVV